MQNLFHGWICSVTCATTLRQKLQIKIAISSTCGILTLGQSDLALILSHQAVDRVPTGVSMFEPLAWRGESRKCSWSTGSAPDLPAVLLIYQKCSWSTGSAPDLPAVLLIYLSWCGGLILIYLSWYGASITGPLKWLDNVRKTTLSLMASSVTSEWTPHIYTWKPSWQPEPLTHTGNTVWPDCNQNYSLAVIIHLWMRQGPEENHTPIIICQTRKRNWFIDLAYSAIESNENLRGFRNTFSEFFQLCANHKPLISTGQLS